MICRLCPRDCVAVRDEEMGTGYCRMPALPKLARVALHHWEEPPISGCGGSGTIFFSGCALNCIFCQNHQISQKDFGQICSLSQVRQLILNLVDQGAHNINLVNPSHYAHLIPQLLEEPLPVPVVWNSGGYDKVSTLKNLAGKIQIYLPDLKYLSSDLAQAYSSAPDYPHVATSAILEMVEQVGAYQLDEEGILQRGVIIRHLVLPGHLEEAKAVMDWVAGTFPPKTVLFSLMGQYIPCGKAVGHPKIGRVLRKSELRAAVSYMDALGLEGFAQEASAASDTYIPDFDLTGIGLGST